MNQTSESTLKYEGDRYDGVIVNERSLPESRDDFAKILKCSLRVWKAADKRGVWLKIPVSKIDFASVAVEFGFAIHHAEKEYLMLTHWLSEDENKLPSNASHQVGVGCVVINTEGKMLAVQECNGPLKGLGIWKLPTGLADAREDIDSAARREVLEETGIETDFVGIFSFQQAHNAQFGKSDMFFICLLKPKTFEIKKQECEIFACEWIDVESYIGQDFFLTSPSLSRMNEIVADIVKNTAHKNYLQKHELEARKNRSKPAKKNSLYILPSFSD